ALTPPPASPLPSRPARPQPRLAQQVHSVRVGVRQVLEHLGLPADVPPVAPARGPPEARLLAAGPPSTLTHAGLGRGVSAACRSCPVRAPLCLTLPLLTAVLGVGSPASCSQVGTCSSYAHGADMVHHCSTRLTWPSGAP